ncbi:hypothetical protein ACIBAG_38205 [Streptomyces sp. NPDC051243]|uniref:hypothetical protein n=1 Tax=Streptomyces sp. NPDC051243 TaxID=3365646 RepID=UPI0037B17187
MVTLPATLPFLIVQLSGAGSLLTFALGLPHVVGARVGSIVDVFRATQRGSGAGPAFLLRQGVRLYSARDGPPCVAPCRGRSERSPCSAGS